MMDSQTEKLTEPLGLSLLDGGGVFSTWSESASSIELHILNQEDTSLSEHVLPLERGDLRVLRSQHRHQLFFLMLARQVLVLVTPFLEKKLRRRMLHVDSRVN